MRKSVIFSALALAVITGISLYARSCAAEREMSQYRQKWLLAYDNAPVVEVGRLSDDNELVRACLIVSRLDLVYGHAAINKVIRELDGSKFLPEDPESGHFADDGAFRNLVEDCRSVRGYSGGRSGKRPEISLAVAEALEKIVELRYANAVVVPNAEERRAIESRIREAFATQKVGPRPSSIRPK